MVEFKVPATPRALRAVAVALEEIAYDVESKDLAAKMETPAPIMMVKAEEESFTEFENRVASEMSESLEVPAPPVETPAAEATEVPAPPQSAEGVIAAPDVPAPPTGDIDARGIVWDARIHASTKTKTAKGLWKNLRGVDKALLATVEAELLGQATAPTDTPAADVPAPPAPTEAPADAITEFPALMDFILAGGFTAEVLAEACNSVGCPGGIMTIAATPEKIPALHAALTASA